MKKLRAAHRHRRSLQALHSQNVAARLRPTLTGPEAVTQGKANEEACAAHRHRRSQSAATLLTSTNPAEWHRHAANPLLSPPAPPAPDSPGHTSISPHAIPQIESSDRKIPSASAGLRCHVRASVWTSCFSAISSTSINPPPQAECRRRGADDLASGHNARPAHRVPERESRSVGILHAHHHWPADVSAFPCRP